MKRRLSGPFSRTSGQTVKRRRKVIKALIWPSCSSLKKYLAMIRNEKRPTMRDFFLPRRSNVKVREKTSPEEKRTIPYQRALAAVGRRKLIGRYKNAEKGIYLN
jgi:hypothetical protein